MKYGPIFRLLSASALTLTTASRSSAATLRVPDDLPTIGAAIAAAGTSSTIEIASSGPFRENLDFRRAAAGLTLRAAPGVRPVVLGDTSSVPILQTRNNVRIEGIEFRLDLAEPEAPGGGLFSRIAQIAGGEASFAECEFDATGPTQTASALGGALVAVEGPARADFDGCRFEIKDAGQLLPGGFALLAASGPAGLALSRCDFVFDAEAAEPDRLRAVELLRRAPTPADRGLTCAAALRISGSGDISVSACSFSSGATSAAGAYCQILDHGIPVSFDKCIFGQGYKRGIMLLGNRPETAKLVGCIAQAPMTMNGRFLAALPGPPSRTLIARNSVFQFYSYLNDAWDATHGSVVSLEHCTFVDTAGLEGSNELRIVDLDTTSALHSAVRNCVFVAPRVSGDGLIYDIDLPGRPLRNASGNVALRLGLADSLTSATAATGDPRVGEDLVHLLKGSIARGAATAIGVDTDFEGDPRPMAGLADAGADQALSNPDMPPFFDPSPAWKADAPTTQSADQAAMHRLQVLNLRLEYGRARTEALEFVRNHPDSPWIVQALLFIGSYDEFWSSRLETVSAIEKIPPDTAELMRAEMRSDFHRFLDATRDPFRSGYPDDIRFRPAVLIDKRLWIQYRLDEQDAAVKEADRILKRQGISDAIKGTALYWRTIALCSQPEHRAEGAASAESFLLGDPKPILAIRDHDIVEIAEWGVYAALDSNRPEIVRKLGEFVRRFPANPASKSRFLRRYSRFLTLSPDDPPSINRQ